MFEKILIANRGEIACRIIETAHRLGVRTVAVYSDADANARHVEMAGEAVHIGRAPAAESYLNGVAIITAAKETGAEGIHPGYGFLSENPDFADDVAAAGLTFIGPTGASIRAMGLKDAAKKLMEKAGVPVVPGYLGENQDPDHLKAEAAKVGYPVLIKAVAGGGGKGMRRVDAAQGFDNALKSAQSEAQKAFGNDAVLVEKYIEKPRHIEFQIFGDGKDVVHLFERDCSLQRRHQKVIEEAPAPSMTAEMREAMASAAVNAARAINYRSAGTIEFIVDASNGLRPSWFWFMEMNTRLQVEHPVTEAITGIDLVEWQLRVAAGESLPKSQDQITLNGHAFEARLYSEDAENGFLPVTGNLTHLQFSDLARNDTGVREGDVISPHYDPMIAKITVHSSSRELALSQLSAALDGTGVAGTVTNLAFLQNLSRNKDFRAGNVDTGLIERNVKALTVPKPTPNAAILIAMLSASGLDEQPAQHAGFTLWQPLSQTLTIGKGEQIFSAKLMMQGADRGVINFDGQDYQISRTNGAWTINNRKSNLRAVRMANTVSVFGNGAWHFEMVDPLKISQTKGDVSDVIVAPMPGLVRAVFVKVGQKVTMGDPLAVLEAMKMEHTLTAPRNGMIAEVLVKADDQVQAGAALVRLEEPE